MKAIVYHAPQDIRVEDLPGPACGDDELLVDVDACAICGTDLKAFAGKQPFLEYPRILGHELGVEIVEIGQLMLNLLHLILFIQGCTCAKTPVS